MQKTPKDKNCILIVDDDFMNRELLKNIFSSRFTFEEADNGKDGLLRIEQYAQKLCAIILDVEMPKMSGIEVLEVISKQGITEQIPVFLITAHDNDDVVENAYRLGVMDVISKPVSPVVIQRRVKTVIELYSTRERLHETVKGQQIKISESEKAIDELHRGTLEALATAIEFRDVESGEHVSRIYGMTKYILLHTAFGEGLSKEDIENIARASIMHDVGKIAISDVILNKPGKLTKEEFEIMKLHTVKGAELLEQISKSQAHVSYRYAADIARHHHERWDGKGYPDGLKGEEISVAAQAVSIADVYDALVSVRVYKKAFTPDEAVNMIKNGACGTFNPKLMECFLQAEPVIRQWYTAGGDGSVLEELTQDTDRVQALYNGTAKAMENNTTNAVLDFMLLMTAVQTAYDMIISVNLTKNTYYMIDYDRFQTHCAQGDGVFDELIEAGASSIPVSHRREFHDTFCRENLLKEFHAGKKSVYLEHPQYADDGNLHWVATEVLFMKDYRTGDILQITLSQYIDKEYQMREETRKILTDAVNITEQANTVKSDTLCKIQQDVRAIYDFTNRISENLDNKQEIQNYLTQIRQSSEGLLHTMEVALDFTK